MLDDTIIAKHKTATVLATVAATDTSKPGQTIRKDLNELHVLQVNVGQKTNENPGYVSRRLSVRLNVKIPSGILRNGLGPEANAFAQVIFGYPDDPLMAASLLSQPLAALVHVICGGNTTTVPLQSDNADLVAGITRLMTGEN